MLKLCHRQRRKAGGLKAIEAKGYYYLILLDLKMTIPTGWCNCSWNQNPGGNQIQ